MNYNLQSASKLKIGQTLIYCYPGNENKPWFNKRFKILEICDDFSIKIGWLDRNAQAVFEEIYGCDRNIFNIMCFKLPPIDRGKICKNKLM